MDINTVNWIQDLFAFAMGVVTKWFHSWIVTKQDK